MIKAISIFDDNDVIVAQYAGGAWRGDVRVLSSLIQIALRELHNAGPHSAFARAIAKLDASVPKE